MADTPPTVDTTKPAMGGAPKSVKMPRAVSELVTGTKPDQMIPAGELITDELAKEHKLDAKQIKALTERGAIDLVDVLKG